MDWFEFDVEGAAGLHVRVESQNGQLKFVLDNTGDQVADLRGLFFDLKNSATIGSLSASGSSITAQAKGDEAVVNLGNGATMAGAGTFDFGVAFGTAGIGKDDIHHAEFTLSSAAGPLSLADVYGMDFGVRFTSVGDEGGARSGSLKLTDKGFGEIHYGTPPIGPGPIGPGGPVLTPPPGGIVDIVL